MSDKAGWKALVERLGEPGDVTLGKAVKAHELARLRWREGAKVKRAEFVDGDFRLIFADGTMLVILAPKEDENWDVVEPGVAVEDARWSVTCEHGEISSRTPLGE